MYKQMRTKGVEIRRTVQRGTNCLGNDFSNARGDAQPASGCRLHSTSRRRRHAQTCGFQAGREGLQDSFKDDFSFFIPLSQETSTSRKMAPPPLPLPAPLLLRAVRRLPLTAPSLRSFSVNHRRPSGAQVAAAAAALSESGGGGGGILTRSG